MTEELDIQTILGAVQSHFCGDTEAQRLIGELKQRIDSRTELNDAIGQHPAFEEMPMGVPDEFSDALDRTIERLALLINIVAHLGDKKKSKRGLDGIKELLDATFRDASSKTYQTYYSRRLAEKTEREIVALNEALEKRAIEVNNELRVGGYKVAIARNSERIQDLDRQIAEYDKSGWPVLFAECDKKTREIEVAREAFLEKLELPADFRPMRMFEGFPLDQFAFELQGVEAQRNAVDSDFRRLCELRQKLEDANADIRSWMAGIERGEPEPVEVSDVSRMREFWDVCQDLRWPLKVEPDLNSAC